jgi:hypothetical protein
MRHFGQELVADATLLGRLTDAFRSGFTLLMLIPYAPRLAVRLPVAGGLLWMLVAWCEVGATARAGSGMIRP